MDARGGGGWGGGRGGGHLGALRKVKEIPGLRSDEIYFETVFERRTSGYVCVPCKIN